MTPNGTAQNGAGRDLGRRLDQEIAALIESLAFPAGKRVRRDGELVALEINPRRPPHDPQSLSPPERLDLELLIEAHAPVLETDREVIAGMQDAYQKMIEDETPNIRAIGKAKAEQLRDQLARPRLRRSDLTGLTFLLSREALPTWIHMLPAAAPDEWGRARFEDVPAGSICRLALISVPSEVRGQRMGALHATPEVNVRSGAVGADDTATRTRVGFHGRHRARPYPAGSL